jgi:hypothetical protein
VKYSNTRRRTVVDTGGRATDLVPVVKLARVQGHPRNYVLYNARLGNVLARSGKLEESISVLTPVLSRVNTLGSYRLRNHLRDAVDVLARHQDYRPALQFTAWSRKLLDAA